MTRDEQKAMLDFARKRDIAIISDEVYGTLVFDGSVHAPSFLQIADAEDNLFVVNSFSKPWAMTGWRIGWLVHPKSLDEQMKVICIANNTAPTMLRAIRRASPRCRRRAMRSAPRCSRAAVMAATLCRASSTARTASAGCGPKARSTASSMSRA